MPWTARLYLAEALASLAAARFALWLLPFARLTWFLERVPRTEIHGEERETRRKGVQWAIGKASSYLPGETTCFPRAIAAQAMLRWRGIPTTLYYGALTLANRELRAHVWLQDGAAGVVGHEAAEEYHILARYPKVESATTESPRLVQVQRRG